MNKSCTLGVGILMASTMVYKVVLENAGEKQEEG